MASEQTAAASHPGGAPAFSLPQGTVDSLSSLGGDLTLTIALSVANELIAAAQEAELGEVQLMAAVLCVSVGLSALPKLLALAATELRLKLWLFFRRSPSHGSQSGILAFVELFVRIAQRISVSVCVQLVARNVVAQQQLRGVRVLTLVAVAVFFVFLESTSRFGRVERRSS